MAKYRGGVIGLGYIGMIGVMGAVRIGPQGERWGETTKPFWHPDDPVRPTSKLDVHRRSYPHEHPGGEGLPGAYTEALYHRSEVELVAAAERDPTRRDAFRERYGIEAVYSDAEEMLRKERLDIVGIPTNTKSRPDLTVLAVECGARGIMTEKPIAYTLEDADRMVKACADAGVPFVCGAITTNHPAFGRAKQLIASGAIGEVTSIEANAERHAISQHQNWSYFVDSAPAWVIGTSDTPAGDQGSEEFDGQGMMVTVDGLVVHFRKGTPGVRITGTSGEVLHLRPSGWRLWQDVETQDGRKQRIEMPWPEPQMTAGGHGGIVYGFADVLDCLAGRLDEPKNSGRRVAVALEVEIALKLSAAQGGVRVDLPLEDRTLDIKYDWHR